MPVFVLGMALDLYRDWYALVMFVVFHIIDIKNSRHHNPLTIHSNFNLTHQNPLKPQKLTDTKIHSKSIIFENPF